MGQFMSGEQSREQIRAGLAMIDAGHKILRETPTDEVGNSFRAELAEQLETQDRSNRGLMYRTFGEIADPPDETGCVPALVDTLWARLRVAPKEIKRRMKLAGRIRPRRSLTGPALPPELPLLAAAVQAGVVGEDHLRAICRAIDVLPSCVSVTDRADIERSLVREATKNDAEIVTAAGRRIDTIFNPDGHYDEADRARRRGLRLGPQGPDGMSNLAGLIDPETRCYVEAVTAAVRPGRHQPDGTTVQVRDDRSPAQRSLMLLSSCDGGGVVSLAGAKHRVEHVDTSAGKGEHCFAVTLAFAAFALVVGLAGRIAADRAECRVVKDASEISAVRGRMLQVADFAGLLEYRGESSGCSKFVGCREAVDPAGNGEEFRSQRGPHPRQTADEGRVRVAVKDPFDFGVNVG